MSYPWTKESLEDFLSVEMGGEKVVVDEPHPVIVKEVSLAQFGVISYAVIYKNAVGELRAALVPFGVGVKTAA